MKKAGTQDGHGSPESQNGTTLAHEVLAELLAGEELEGRVSDGSCRRLVAPVPSADAAKALHKRLTLVIGHIERGFPLNASLLTNEDLTDYARELVLRLLRSGVADAGLQSRLAQYLEIASDKEFRRALSVKAKKWQDFVTPTAIWEAFFIAREQGRDVPEAIVMAYERRYGPGTFEADRDRTAGRERDSWHKQFPRHRRTRASKQLVDVVLPALKPDVPSASRALDMLGFGAAEP